jgi:hypothetical protein
VICRQKRYRHVPLRPLSSRYGEMGAAFPILGWRPFAAKANHHAERDDTLNEKREFRDALDCRH